MKKIYFTFLAITFSLSTMAQIYVDVDATGNNDGTSWADAYTDLKTALDSNTLVDNPIWIAEGTYYLTAAGNSFTIAHGENIYGGFNGTETLLTERDFRNNITILSGDVNQNDAGTPASTNNTMTDNAANIIKINSPHQEVILDGITIESAFSTTAAGGGILVQGTDLIDLTVRNCIIRNNVSANRAGLLFYTSKANSHLYLYNTIIENNVNTGSAAYTIEFRFASGNPTGAAHLVNNLFRNNTCEGSQSGITLGRFTNLPQSGEMYVYLVNNIFIDNPQVNPNSALFGFEYGSSVVAQTEIRMNNNIFYNNPNVIKQFGFLGGSTIQAYNTIMEQDCYENVQDFTDVYTMQATHQVSSSPFIDYANGNLVPIAAYQTSGRYQAYDSSYPPYDLAGNPRLTNTGQIGAGAYQYTASASINDTFNTVGIDVYPNPSKSVFKVKTPKTMLAYKLFDINGKIIQSVKQLDKNEITIDLSKFTSGLYFLQLNTNDGIKNVKLMKL
ncbi:MAG TPA: T9SS type A sorting domain-containing protein [Flavobacteriia bacterium]|nr:T9SS type A sorting domain-containing protein [Flavobacteriia bacterium]